MELFFRYSCFVCLHRFDFPYIIIFDGHRFLEAFYIRNLEDKNKFEAKLESFKNRVLIYPMIEVFDIEYFCEFFSDMKTNLIKQIIENKLKTEFPSHEFKKALFAKGGSSKGKQNYIFIVFNMSKQLKAYIRYLDSLPYLIRGVFLAPVETLHMVQYIIQSNKADKISNGFQIFILECSENYLRVVVLNRGSFVLSRGITLLYREGRDLQSKEVTDEIRNTINYALESYRITSSNVSLYCIVSRNTSSLLTNMELHVNAIFIYFLENSAEKFKIRHDHIRSPINNADILSAFFFLKNRPALQFDTKKTVLVNNLINIAVLCDVCTVLLFFLLFTVNIVMLTELGHEANIMHSLTKKDNSFLTQYHNLSSEYKTQSEDMNAIELVINEYNTALKQKDYVLRYIKNISQITKANEHLDILSFKLNKPKDATSLIIEARLNFQGLQYQEAETEYVELVKKVSNIFNKCKTTVSAIPLDINEKGIEKPFPIEIKAEGNCYAN